MDSEPNVARIATGLDGKRHLGYEVAGVGADQAGTDHPLRPRRR